MTGKGKQRRDVDGGGERRESEGVCRGEGRTGEAEKESVEGIATMAAARERGVREGGVSSHGKGNREGYRVGNTEGGSEGSSTGSRRGKQRMVLVALR